MASHKKSLLKVIILGDSGVGKTSLAHQYVKNSFSDTYQVTIDADFFKKVIRIDDTEVTMHIWDTAGMERFKSFSASYYRGADGCVLVYDVNARKTLESLESWRDDFLKNVNPDNPEHFPFVVVGNKCDLGNRQVTTRHVQQWCQSKNNLPFYETSAKDGLNVELAFKTLAKFALKRKAKLQRENETSDQIRLDSDKNKLPTVHVEMTGFNNCQC